MEPTQDMSFARTENKAIIEYPIDVNGAKCTARVPADALAESDKHVIPPEIVYLIDISLPAWKEALAHVRLMVAQGELSTDFS